MGHEKAAELLREEVVRGRGCAADGQEDAVGGGEVFGFREERCAVRQHRQGMRGLTLVEKGDIDRDDGVALLGDEFCDEGAAEGLDSRGGCGEPLFRDPQELFLVLVGSPQGRSRRQLGERGGGMGLADDLEEGREGSQVARNGSVDGAGDAVICRGAEG